MGEAAPARLRVLFVVSSLGGGGAERFVATALAHLDRARVEPELCLFRRDLVYGLPPDVGLRVLDKRRPWDIPGAIWRLARWIDRSRPDVVFSAFAHPSFVTGMALGLCRARPRWLARVSNDPARGEGGAPRPLMRRLYRRAEGIVCNSEGLARAFAAAYPALAPRVAWLPNAVDFERIDRLAAEAPPEPPPPGPTVATVGSLSRQKRTDLLVAALAALPRSQPARLLVLGEGPERARLERQIRRAGLGERVHLLGFQANPFAWLARADVFASASDYEGLPNAMIEAQGLGLPVVATDCPYGPAEIVADGETGLLSACGRAEPLAASLAALLADPERRRRMGAAARARARSLFDASAVVRRLEQHLLGPAAEGPRPRPPPAEAARRGRYSP